jgi:hypothetical protein
MLRIRRSLSGWLVLLMVLSLLPGMPIAALADMESDEPLPVPGIPQKIEYSPVTASSVTINWEPVEGAEGYHIYRRDARRSTAELIDTVDGVGYVDLTVVPGTDYWYSISAFNSSGEGERSKEAFIVLPRNTVVEVNRFEVFTTGSRLRLGDLDGDGRTDILVANITHQSDYTVNGSVIYALVAYNIEGDVLWTFSLDPNFRLRNENDPWNYDAGSGVRNSSADEPVNITDVNGDGYNEVVAIMHPSKNRGSNYTGGVFLILDGRTGQILLDASGRECRINIEDLDIPGKTTTGGRPNVNRLGDQIIFANLDGRTTPDGKSLRQHVVIKARYDSVTALEMFDKDGNFTMDFVFQQTGRYPGQNQSEAGHTVLAIDLDGDGIEELVSNYTVFKSYIDEDGNLSMDAWWWIKSNVEMRSGKEGDPKNDPTPVYYPGTTERVQTSGHVDTIQAGYLYDGGELVIIFGGAGPDGANSRASTFAYTWDGRFLWVSRSATEPQSLVLGRFRTDSPGLTTYGLDRRQRSNWPNGKDGLFLIGTNGEVLMSEPNNRNGSWSTIVIRVDNWTGTYATMAMAFNRNTQAIEAGHTTNPERLKPSLYDGYFNLIFEMEDPTPETEYRFMAADIMGDSKTELIGYTDGRRQNNQALAPIEQFGVISIFYNDTHGDAEFDENGKITKESALAIMRSGITGQPKPMTNFMSNYSRYPTDWYFENIEEMAPASVQIHPVSPSSNYITWTPILIADSYTLYKNGEKIGDFVDIGYLDEDVVPGSTNTYTVVAHQGDKSSRPSYPRSYTSGKEQPEAYLSGSASVVAGSTFDLNFHIKGVDDGGFEQVLAQDLTIRFDPDALTFVQAESLVEGLEIIDSKEVSPGTIRFLTAALGEDKGTSANGDFLKFTFIAKPVAASGETSVTVEDVVLANRLGQELTVPGSTLTFEVQRAVDKSALRALISTAQSLHDAAQEGNAHGLYAPGSKAALQAAIEEAQAVADQASATQQQVDAATEALAAAIAAFEASKISADVNGDEAVSIGDLAIVAAGFGKTSSDSDWDPYKSGDVNHDGVIDIADLAIVAAKILE